MKTFLTLLVLVFAANCFAFQGPYVTKEIRTMYDDLNTAEASLVVAEAALDVVEAQVGASTVVQGLEGFGLERILIVNYNSDTDPSDASASAPWSLSIPAKSLITQVGFVADVVASASSSGNFQLSIGCESAQDLLSDQDMVISSISAATSVEGVVKAEDPSTHVYTLSGCTPWWAVNASDSILESASGTTALDLNVFVKFIQMD